MAKHKVAKVRRLHKQFERAQISFQMVTACKYCFIEADFSAQYAVLLSSKFILTFVYFIQDITRRHDIACD
jgi:hypothetical protein